MSGSGKFEAPLLATAGNVYVYGSGKFEAPLLGAVIASDTSYSLFARVDGSFSAGCRKNLTREQALRHWARDDDRAMLFTLAIGLQFHLGITCK